MSEYTGLCCNSQRLFYLLYNQYMENNENLNIVPSVEKVVGFINRLTDGIEIKVVKEKTNEEGILVELEVQVQERDDQGNSRQFDYLLNKAGKVTLDEVWFDSDGMPIGGKKIADYVDGNWRIVGE